MNPTVKRVLITRIIADTHESLAKSGAFERSFAATGTWVPVDGSADDQVRLQGTDINYKSICNQKAIEEHKKKLDELEAQKAEKLKAAAREAEEKKLALAETFSQAVRRSRRYWNRMLPQIVASTANQFSAIAALLGGSFVCAGSYPAHVVVEI